MERVRSGSSPTSGALVGSGGEDLVGAGIDRLGGLVFLRLDESRGLAGLVVLEGLIRAKV
jgi:hypothetical protein